MNIRMVYEGSYSLTLKGCAVRDIGYGDVEFYTELKQLILLPLY